jgi:hypothetical protein
VPRGKHVRRDSPERRATKLVNASRAWSRERGLNASSQLTKADNHALEKMPDGWFQWHDVPYVVRCPEYRCRRLVEKGLLERRLIGQYPDSYWEYKKTGPRQEGQDK